MSRIPTLVKWFVTFRFWCRVEHLVAGVSGGVAATVLLHPLDLLKIRFAVNDGRNAAGRPSYAGMKNAVANIGTARLELSCVFRIALL
jgi:hypothetical protein